MLTMLIYVKFYVATLKPISIIMINIKLIYIYAVNTNILANYVISISIDLVFIDVCTDY